MRATSASVISSPCRTELPCELRAAEPSQRVALDRLQRADQRPHVLAQDEILQSGAGCVPGAPGGSQSCPRGSCRPGRGERQESGHGSSGGRSGAQHLSISSFSFRSRSNSTAAPTYSNQSRSSAALSRSALARVSSSTVRIVTSGLSGTSYGALMPVKSSSLPARARA